VYYFFQFKQFECSVINSLKPTEYTFVFYSSDEHLLTKKRKLEF